ncbi:Nitrogen fixation protein of unknown function [Synechococcus sp. MIT S9509]|uniref:Nif11-like leader peptide family natural product precursor n=1 Tax=unclassified Synechococcus TaxID=2626047 RepID=UPI0007BBB2A3|nr:MULTISPECIES: Nif11-like leader peptide family natural product precursor [unclassified Synechococcus]KZR84143.1 Nitrogen fixation protein of unknown function [Synechococcus sp. MIT S9504]KZR88888.1 Nitrogen fixation protein of unknown function [Synechococcus sp. MIT S9509]
MSEEQLQAFLEKAKADTTLQEKLKAAKTPDEVVSIAKEHGHEFTADKISQLSESELEGVSGGAASAIVGDCQSQEGHVCFSEGEVVCGKR